MLQFWYPKHLPTFRHASWHPVHSPPPRCQKPSPMHHPRLHARDCPLQLPKQLYSRPATALCISITARVRTRDCLLHVHRCTRSRPALPFTPPSNARPRISRLTKYKFSVFFVFKNYFFEIPLYFCTNFTKNMLIFFVNHI